MKQPPNTGGTRAQPPGTENAGTETPGNVASAEIKLGITVKWENGTARYRNGEIQQNRARQNVTVIPTPHEQASII
jgi:hypothetical protein